MFVVCLQKLGDWNLNFLFCAALHLSAIIKGKAFTLLVATDTAVLSFHFTIATSSLQAYSNVPLGVFFRCFFGGSGAFSNRFSLIVLSP